MECRKEIMQAKKYFETSLNCAQSVLTALLEDRTNFNDALPYLSAGLGGGISFSGNVCGAVSGAILAMGWLTRRETTEITKHKRRTFDHAEDFIKQFREKHGSILCKNLIGFDISDTDLFRKAREEGYFQKCCPKLVESAVKQVLEIMDI